MKKKVDKDLIWMILILALLGIVLLVSGMFYFSLSVGSATGHVIVNDKSKNLDKVADEKQPSSRVDFTGFSVSG